MLGEYKNIMYGTKEVKSFFPYSLNELYITANANYEVDKLLEEIESLFPLPTPSNLFFYDLIQDKEMIDSLNLDGAEHTLDELHAPSSFNLFAHELSELKEIFTHVPKHMDKLGFSNRFLKDFHHALFNKHISFYPGEFRKTVSFSGAMDIEQATFVSCSADHLQRNMDEMELFMHRDDISVFLRSAYLYYQIMVNLPFLIGNGTIARATSQLYLREFSTLNHYIPLSKYLKKIEKKRNEAILKEDINIFLISYLKALKAAITEAKEMILSFNKLKINQKRKIEKSNHTIYQKRRLNEILHQSFKTIYLPSEALENRFDVQRKTIIKRYRLLQDLGIIKVKEAYFENIYYNEGMLKIIDG